MKTLTFLSIAIFSMSAAHAGGLANLEKAQGEYKVADQSDRICNTLKSFKLQVIGEDAIIDFEADMPNNGLQARTESINDINTRKYTSHNTLTAIVYHRNVFKKNKLIKQESTWGLGIFPARYQDSRVILEIKDENSMIYNIPYYGTKTCELTRL